MWTKCYFWTCFCLPLTFFPSFSCLFFLFLPKAPQEARFLPSSTCGGMRALWLVSHCCSDRSVFLSPTGDGGRLLPSIQSRIPRGHSSSSACEHVSNQNWGSERRRKKISVTLNTARTFVWLFPDDLLGRSSQQPLKFTGNGVKNRKSPMNVLRFLGTLLRF